MGFSREEYWSGLPFPSPGDLPDLGIEPRSPSLQADVLTSEPTGNDTGELNVNTKRWSGVPLPSPHDGPLADPNPECH